MSITLIGMAGVGKSVVGRALAKKLRYSFIDVDTLIRSRMHMALQKIINRYGERAFLRIEARGVLDIDFKRDCIVSPGGSIVYSPKAMRYLARHSKIILLDTAFNNITHWIPNTSQRGIVNLKHTSLKKLFNERKILYKKYADSIVKLTREYRLERIVDAIIAKA